MKGFPAIVSFALLVAVQSSGAELADDALVRAAAAVDGIIAVPDTARTFVNTIEAMDDLVARLELDTNYDMFMAYVSTDAEQRDRGLELEELVTNWLNDLGQNEPLYEAVRAFADQQSELDDLQQRMLDHALRDFRRAGMALEAPQRTQLAQIKREITKLSIEFETNIREDATVVPLTTAELEGMSPDYLSDLTRSADMFLVGLSYPEVFPILDLLANEVTRHKMWLAYKRRGGRKNIAVLEELLVLRNEAARLLGYANVAEYEIEIKMARTPQNVTAFYQKLQPLVRRKALRDYEELDAAKQRETGSTGLKPWDTSYYMNVLRREQYSVDVEELREYFPLDRVMEGLFSITQSLYGITYKEVTAVDDSASRPLWHPDVRLYQVWDDASGERLGDFYLDLHPRLDKYGHAAQWGLAQHKRWSDGRVTRPVAALVCNFTKPTDEKPSLLTHDEVETLFHEFGHCLHTILSEAPYWTMAGTNVERDFVEAPSQMFENWVWDADILASLARHYETGEPLPASMLEGMLAARHLGSGLRAERQFYYGLFDMTCHLDDDGVVDTTKLAGDLWGSAGEGVELYAAVPEIWFQAAFGHLTGYQAGYYGYQWSLVYACDMFQRFEELGMLDPKAGSFYRRQILARGGTMDALDLVQAYLGREPDMGAYLRHLGLEDE
ncbi:MAG: M3 family metallopeptidase [Candidatus Latescibacterota bacterium]|jgi:thimet oligopeptidase